MTQLPSTVLADEGVSQFLPNGQETVQVDTEQVQDGGEMCLWLAEDKMVLLIDLLGL